MPRKSAPRRERVAGGPNSGDERRRHRVAAQFSLSASGQGEAAREPLLVVRKILFNKEYESLSRTKFYSISI
ncbi:conserved hypothetical protein [Dickeya chrysanthemi Ech1591]|uniref:Uncharacterized protein n=1 Tax=Dickeya chrysanthemi (strain Ech1591) TaxID=561229 RepID=C6CLC3_DICC1|nr:conserved hypothetical protein [Dickeya chrysanthemi Ech1591]